MAFAAGVATGALLCAAAAAWQFRERRRRLGRFLSFAAHEINTPITAVNMTILNLLGGVFGEVPADQIQWIEMMREQLVRLNGMVGELRDLIHLELHRDLSAHLEDMSVSDAVETALAAVRYGCAHSDIALEAAVSDGLPMIRADADRLPRTLSSLLFHARKFRSEGPLRISARAVDGGRFVEAAVEFTGPALSQEQVRQSLDVYFPARQRSDQNLTATGLGLGVLRALMRRQGGDLVHDADGRGRIRLILRIPAKTGA